MKKLNCLLLAIMIISSLVGCQYNTQSQTTSGSYDLYDGYLVINNNQLLVNDFKFIDLTDKYWIDTLELTTEDMPNGYYIYDTSDELLTFTLSNETRYNFYDTEAQFVSENDEDRLYTTTNLNDFLAKFDVDGDKNLSKIPFEIQVLEDGRVISISEIFSN